MARGWESKSVEAQIDMAEASHTHFASEHPLDPAELELLRKKENLLLSRTRVMRELDSVQNPRYRAQLGKALADLDAQLAKIG